MNFLEKYGFEKEDINEFENNTPKKIKDVILKNLELVETNLKLLLSLSINSSVSYLENISEKLLASIKNISG